MMYVTVCSQEYFDKLLSRNTAFHYIHQCKLSANANILCTEEAIYQQHPETLPTSLGSSSSEMDAQWKHTLWSDGQPFKLFMEIIDVVFSGPKKKRTIRKKIKKPVMV